ncbi:MAG: hypothetical protein FD129_3076 [bacterium]|nr:MAG: hypothetical protein FD129_3076 [bacterium]
MTARRHGDPALRGSGLNHQLTTPRVRHRQRGRGTAGCVPREMQAARTDSQVWRAGRRRRWRRWWWPRETEVRTVAQARIAAWHSRDGEQREAKIRTIHRRLRAAAVGHLGHARFRPDGEPQRVGRVGSDIEVAGHGHRARLAGILRIPCDRVAAAGRRPGRRATARKFEGGAVVPVENVEALAIEPGAGLGVLVVDAELHAGQGTAAGRRQDIHEMEGSRPGDRNAPNCRGRTAVGHHPTSALVLGRHRSDMECVEAAGVRAGR